MPKPPQVVHKLFTDNVDLLQTYCKRERSDRVVQMCFKTVLAYTQGKKPSDLKEVIDLLVTADKLRKLQNKSDR